MRVLRLKRKYRFGLQKKLTLFTTVVATVTYSVSAIFIYILYDYVKEYITISTEFFMILTLLLGVIWTGILTFLFARIITKSLHRLEAATSEAARGNLDQTIAIPKSDDEIRSLSISVDTMFTNIQQMVNDIEQNFDHTNDTVHKMQELVTATTNHSQNISDATADIAQGAINSADAIQETAMAVERATAIAEDVQHKAEQSNEKSLELLTT